MEKVQKPSNSVNNIVCLKIFTYYSSLLIDRTDYKVHPASYPMDTGGKDAEA
jgi:hypothetical protein